MTEIKEKDLQNVTGGGIMSPTELANKNKFKETDLDGCCENYDYARSSLDLRRCGNCRYCIDGGDGICYCKKMKGESL